MDAAAAAEGPGRLGNSQGNRHSLNLWVALTRVLDDGDLPIDNNWVENRIRPIALGRQNWLFAVSVRRSRLDDGR